MFFLRNGHGYVTRCLGSKPFHHALSSRRSALLFSTSTTSTTTPSSSTELNFELPTNQNNKRLLAIRHSTAHVMAMAVQKLFPGTKVAIGPWTENGFFYDFAPKVHQMSDHDLKHIKKEMDNIVKMNLPIVREEVTREEARKRILEQEEPYKLEILDSIPAHESISLYHIGDVWWDLCAGPHLNSTGDIDTHAVELESISGAHWKGNTSDPSAQLQRIHGIAWENNQQLKSYKRRLEEAKLRDHRVIGKRLNLFSIQNDAGGGLVFWHPKGAHIRRQIEDYWKNEHVNHGYELLYTPHIANLDLWKTSGHHDFYRNDMFRPITVDEEEYQLKPMNCPFHCLIYKDIPRSYRDLPIRWAELGTVYRYEQSGSMHGLFRVRGFTQDDAHIFCLPSQLQQEIVGVLDLVEKILFKFGFTKFDIMLSTKPTEHVGSEEVWTKATDALVGALEAKKWKYNVDEGGGAFYGPKIDIKIQDAIGRRWQCSTIQCDFNLPQRFQMEYTTSAGTKEQPIMVHRAIFGSLERFFGVLIEHTAGDFPLWLSPVHVRLLPVVDEVLDYCHALKRLGEQHGIRVEIDSSKERLPKMIRNAEQEKIPLSAVVGMKEKESNTVAVRVRKLGEMQPMASEDFFATLKKVLATEDTSNSISSLSKHFDIK